MVCDLGHKFRERFGVWEGGRDKGRRFTGVPHLQENAPPWDPTVGLCLGSWGGPRGVGGFLCAKYPCRELGIYPFPTKVACWRVGEGGSSCFAFFACGGERGIYYQIIYLLSNNLSSNNLLSNNLDLLSNKCPAPSGTLIDWREVYRSRTFI